MMTMTITFVDQLCRDVLYSICICVDCISVVYSVATGWSEVRRRKEPPTKLHENLVYRLRTRIQRGWNRDSDKVMSLKCMNNAAVSLLGLSVQVRVKISPGLREISTYHYRWYPVVESSRCRW